MTATLLNPRFLRAALPAIALAAVLIPIFVIQPRTMSYFGLNLLLNLAIPIAFATLGQMFILAVNDLDLGVGAFVSLVACIGATLLNDAPLLGVLALVACVATYTAMGALIQLRGLPAIVVTLGMSFVWSGLAIMILPQPGGTVPGWLQWLMALKPPLVPLPVIAALAMGLAVHFGLMRSAAGAVLRGTGGNARAVERAGWSLLRARATMYTLAGVFNVLAGLSLVGITTSADANIALRYTLLSIAGVILGGGEFVGGRVSPIGAVLGALTLTLAVSFLSFLRIPSEWQVGAQGAMLILVLAARAIITRREGGATWKTA